ncbi:MAG: Gfo/Idh/MocA family oxidoreductase [Planctomycetaceae bacterium]|jgi:predicted dehydrogenase|nr:Gfo/Idh/MocA family oxidoreductase [Planctomycetaceae bacterium]
MTTRRRFLQVAALTAASAFAAPAVLGADKNKKYRLALVGSGWWGKNIFNTALASKTVEPVAVVDVDKRQLETGIKASEDGTGITPKRFTDYREMLEQIKPDIVINATPDHWHPLITIAAVHAGANVYVEKPVCHTVNEGIAMVKAARETGKKIQVGTHRRVSPHNQQAIEFLRSGRAGEVGHIRAFVHYQGGAGSPAPDEPVPDGLDWNFWCGPAPLVPFNPRIHPKGFRNFLNFGNGQLGDWGIHWLDQITWWAGDNVYPKSVASTGGRFIAKDNSDGPDTQTVIYQFDNFDLEWEHRRYSGNPPEKHNIGVYFYGTKGTLHLGWQDGWSFYPSQDCNGTPAEHGDPKLDKPDDQNIAGLWANFIDSIEKDRLPVCDIEKGHRSTTLALLGMLSLKLGRGIVWDGEKQVIPNDPAAAKLLSREYRAPWKYPAI